MTIKVEDLEDEFIDTFMSYTREELLLKIKRQQEHYNALMDKQDRLKAGTQALDDQLSRIFDELMVVQSIASQQGEALHLFHEFIDGWLDKKVQSGSRKRSVQIVLEQMVSEVRKTMYSKGLDEWM